MGFISGSVSFRRYKAHFQPSPDDFANFFENAIGREKIASADGVECGWGAGKHILDTDFATEKNILDDFIVFDFIVERTRLPGDKLKAYYEVELAALAKDNPSGFASGRQKREAKEIARERVEQEASDGRYKKRQAIPVCWDTTRGHLLFGATAATNLSRFEVLFEKTFGVSPVPMTASSIAGETDSVTGRDLLPSEFVVGTTPQDFEWNSGDGVSWMGNEFLLWLWYRLDRVSDEIEHPSGNIAAMIARSLTVDCPRGMTGHDTFKSDCPARLPEARRAVRSGKLPRHMGLTLVRHDDQFELKLQAESFVVSGGKLPKPEDGSVRDRVIQRLNSIRDMQKAIDDLYGEFLQRRLSPKWTDELVAIREWLGGAK